jgi:Tol biopolymer transport system component
MSRRSALFAVGSAVGCSLLLLCLCLTILTITTNLASLVNDATTTRVDRIAYIDNDQNIQITDPRGEQRLALTSDASRAAGRLYTYPTWSPNSQQIAFVGLVASRTRREASLYTAPIAGGTRTTVFESALQFPFYVYWAPDNQRIGFLTQGDDGLALMLGQADGKTPARRLETGSPFYWAWSPDSQSMLLHTGGSRRESREARLALLRWQDSKVQTLTRAPGEFEAPHYSPDGKAILYAGTTATRDDALYLADAQDTNARAIATYRGQIAFAWSPDGKKIAWLPTSENSPLVNEGPIFLSDANGENQRKLVDEDVLAFFWSPDSNQIAYITVLLPGENQGRTPGLARPSAQSISFRLRWRLVDVNNGNARTLVTFVPTEAFVGVLPYFDQYARSLTFWSPDSQRLVYTQSEGEEIGSVWVAEVIGNASPRRIGDGTLAVWSWR